MTAPAYLFPSPLQLAAFDNANTLIAAFPLALIPVYLVPLWSPLHITSLAKLRRATVRPGTPSRSATWPDTRSPRRTAQ
jgi:hypothetical protein